MSHPRRVLPPLFGSSNLEPGIFPLISGQIFLGVVLPDWVTTSWPAQQEGYEREVVGAMHHGSARSPVTGFIPQDSLSDHVVVSDQDVQAAMHFLATVRTAWEPLAAALHDTWKPYHHDAFFGSYDASFNKWL